MKLLIDIPEHIYEHARELTEDSRDEAEAMRAIANGSRQESRSEIPNTCGDAVSRDKAILQLRHLLSDWDDDWDACIRMCIETVKILPSVTPPQKVGKWRDTGSGQECSECGEIQYGYDNFRHFCANCGAKMEVEE